MIGSKIIDTQKGVYGHVDFIDERGIGGWILDLDGGVNVVEIYINGVKVFEEKASIHRPDIDSIIGRAVNCGFFIPWRNLKIQKVIFNPNKFEIQVFHKRSGKKLSGKYK